MRLHRGTRFLIALVAVLALVAGFLATSHTQKSRADIDFFGSAAQRALRAPVVGMATTPTGKGYWLVASDGGVFTYGDASFHGSMGGQHVNAPIVDIAPTPSGQGYWLVANDGGVFTYGDAKFFGGLGSSRNHASIMAIEPSRSGNGYWMLGSDGSIYTFGDAPYLGGIPPAQRNMLGVRSMTSTPTGRGYWIVSGDGGVFTFGDAPFLGSAASLHPAAPIVGLDATPTGKGYTLVGSDGGVFTYGDSPFYGSATTMSLRASIVGIAAPPGGGGYWLVGLDGGIFSFDPRGVSSLGPGGVGQIGPSNAAIMRPSGSITITTPGQVVENINVSGTITINANNVTVRNFRAQNVVQNANNGGMLLEDGEVYGGGSFTGDGIAWANYTLRRMNVHNTFDGLKAHGNVLIENSWVHDMNEFKGLQYGAGGYSHNDGLQTSSGSNITIRGSRFERTGFNSAIFIDADQGPIGNVLIENNFIDGGGFSLYSIQSRSAPQFGVPTNVVVRNNVFGSDHLFDYAVLGGGATWTNNKSVAGALINPRRE
ncbi:MAG: Esterase [Actinomycetia bacterium]|nr:Esterase [Actinomycetes bacterium]